MELSSVELKKNIEEADIVLIGIGEEWEPSFETMLKDEDFLKDLELVRELDDYEFTLSILQKKYYSSFHDAELKNAYNYLYNLVSDKNYFLVSLNRDRYPVLAGFDEKQTVFPCGNYKFFQCDQNCENSLLDAEEECNKIISQFRSAKENTISRPVCPFCGSKLVFNAVNASKYCEGGYLDQWQEYMIFMTKTVNKKLCMIELGVSMKYPGIIRNAFERTMTYNKKASLIRIHHSLTDVPEDIEERTYFHKGNSVSYLANLFVSEN